MSVTLDQIEETLRPEHRPLIAAFAELLNEVVSPLAEEIAELRGRLQRPDLVKYSVEEACERLKRSRSGVYDLMKKGELVPVKEAGRTYLTEEEIQRWERTQRLN